MSNPLQISASPPIEKIFSAAKKRKGLWQENHHRPQYQPEAKKAPFQKGGINVSIDTHRPGTIAAALGMQARRNIHPGMSRHLVLGHNISNIAIIFDAKIIRKFDNLTV